MVLMKLYSETQFQVEADSQYCDLDDYLKQELEKLQQEASKEFGEQNRDNRTDRGSYGEARPLSGGGHSI